MFRHCSHAAAIDHVLNAFREVRRQNHLARMKNRSEAGSTVTSAYDHATRSQRHDAAALEGYKGS
jgi:hypothetical protein